LLENRTKASRGEIETVEALEELKELNKRKVVVNYDSLLERYEPVPVVNEVKTKKLKMSSLSSIIKIFITFQNRILIFYIIIKLGRRLERELRMD